MRALSILLLTGCAQTQVVVGHELKGCEDYDPDSPPEERLDYRESDLLVEVFRDGVVQYCDSDFDPEISLEEKTIIIREHWTDTEDDSCTTCFNPTVFLKDPDPGNYDVEWFLGDDQIPFDNIQFEVE